MTTPRIRPLALPDHWTPEQALAVFELIDLLRDELWRVYALDIQRVTRNEQQRPDPRQLSVPPDPNDPF